MQGDAYFGRKIFLLFLCLAILGAGFFFVSYRIYSKICADQIEVVEKRMLAATHLLSVAVVGQEWTQAIEDLRSAQRNAGIALLTVSLLGFLSISIIFIFLYGLIRRKQREDHLTERVSTARKEAIEIVAHDLRSPLGSIRMSLEGLAEAGGDPPLRRKMLEIANRGLKQSFDLIEVILDANRIETGRFSVEKKPCEFHKFLSDQVELLRFLCSSKNITLTVDCPEFQSLVECDQIRIGQVLSNLLGNAVKFSPRDSEIKISVSCRHETLTVSVRDQGPGISDEDRTKIFGRYWQREEYIKSGFGLGLAITKNIVEAHHGKIWVEKPSAGAGSEFFFSLPLHEARAHAAPTPVGPS